MTAPGTPISPAALVGTTVGNTFTLEKLLGQGRHGALFEARHIRLGQKYAVRVLALDSGRRAAVVGALAQCAAVIHPNLVSVRESVVLPDERLALCMPLLPGLNLNQWVSQQGKLSASEGTVMLRQAASGLHALHQRGLVHGGLSPGNLFFTQHDDVAVDNALGSGKSAYLVQLLDAGLHLSSMTPGQAPPSAADDQLALGKLALAFVADLSQGQRRVLERTQEAKAEARFPSVLALWQAFEAAKSPGKRGPTGSVATALVPQIRVQDLGGMNRGRRSIVIGASALVGLSVILGMVIASRRSGPDPAAAALSAPAAAPQVHLAFDVTPSSATVSAGGKNGPASSGLTVPRSDTTLIVTVSADGFQPKSMPVVPNTARTIAVTLAKLPSADGVRDPRPSGSDGDDDGDGDKKHHRREHHRRRGK